jgi:D-arabinose 1-dehydrogenase-like Zn-dependent alcohol dehydrogenase
MSWNDRLNVALSDAEKEKFAASSAAEKLAAQKEAASSAAERGSQFVASSVAKGAAAKAAPKSIEVGGRVVAVGGRVVLKTTLAESKTVPTGPYSNATMTMKVQAGTVGELLRVLRDRRIQLRFPKADCELNGNPGLSFSNGLTFTTTAFNVEGIATE